MLSCAGSGHTVELLLGCFHIINVFSKAYVLATIRNGSVTCDRYSKCGNNNVSFLVV